MKSRINEKEFLNQVILLSVDIYAFNIIHESYSLTENIPESIDKIEVDKAIVLVRSELKKTSVKKKLCEALKSAKLDIREVSKIVGASLLPMSLSGIISLPITPLVFAVAGVLIFDAGISVYCSEFNSEK